MGGVRGWARGGPRGPTGGCRPRRPPIRESFTKHRLFWALFFEAIIRFCAPAEPKRNRDANFYPVQRFRTLHCAHPPLAPCNLQLATCTLSAGSPAACTQPATLQPCNQPCSLACTFAACIWRAHFDTRARQRSHIPVLSACTRIRSTSLQRPCADLEGESVRCTHPPTKPHTRT